MGSNFDWQENQQIPGVAMNPGAGPVHNATLEHAEANMQKLIDDAQLWDASFIYAGDGIDGRHSFEIHTDAAEPPCEVDMPGLPLDEVRYTKSPDQDIFDFPRLYVDGSSWVWCFAIGAVQRHFNPDEEAN